MANKYIVQLRRGTKKEWEDYENMPSHIKPLAGELVIEFDDIDGKKIPRLKIGTGDLEFADLEYISVDSFILPKTALVHIDPSEWKQADDGDDDRYYQVVTVQNAVVTANSKIDLNPTSDDLAIFHEKDLTFVAENWDGQIRVYCICQVQQNAYDIPVTITEVVVNG